MKPDVYMISISNNPISQMWRNLCTPSWELRGYNVNHFEAITEDNGELSFGLLSRENGYYKEFTKNEKGCFLSHYNLWKKSVELDESIIIIEQDCILLSELPELEESQLLSFQYFLNYDGSVCREYQGFLMDDKHRHICGASAYYITPDDAVEFMAEIRYNTITEQIDKYMPRKLNPKEIPYYAQQLHSFEINTITHNYEDVFKDVQKNKDKLK